MRNLHDRFATLDGVAAPDVWADAKRRAAGGATTTTARPSITLRDRQPRTGLSPVLVTLLVAALTASLVLGAIVGNWLDVLPTSTPTAAPTDGPSPTLVTTETPAPTATPQPAACAGTERPADVIETEIAASLTVQHVLFADCTVLIASGFHGDGMTELDPATNLLGEHRLPGDFLFDPTTNDGEVWLVAVPGSGNAGAGPRLVRIDPDEAGLRAAVELPPGFHSATVAIADDRLYVGSVSADYVSVRNRETGGELGRVNASMEPIVVANGWLWGNLDEGGMVRYNLTTEAVETVWPDSYVPYRIGTDSLFLADYTVDNHSRAEIVQLSLADGRLIRRLAFSDPIFYFATDGDDLWVLPYRGDRGATASEVVHLEQATGEVVERFDYAVDNPLGLWAAGNSLWILSNNSRFVRLQLP